MGIHLRQELSAGAEPIIGGKADILIPSGAITPLRGRARQVLLVSSQPRHKLYNHMDAEPVSVQGKIAERGALAIIRLTPEPLGVADGDVVRAVNARGACFAGVL